MEDGCQEKGEKHRRSPAHGAVDAGQSISNKIFLFFEADRAYGVEVGTLDQVTEQGKFEADDAGQLVEKFLGVEQFVGRGFRSQATHKTIHPRMREPESIRARFGALSDT